MRIKDLRKALDFYAQYPTKADPTGIPKPTSLNCYDPREFNYSVADRVKWNIEYKLNSGAEHNVFEYPWMTMEENPLSPYSVY